MSLPSTRPEPRLVLRPPRPDDEEQALQAQLELARDDFNFLLVAEGMSWADWLAKVATDRQGVDLAPGRVPATFLFAEVDGEIVGRTHLRHELTEALREEGGHVGYGVRPQFRRRGYATAILRQSLDLLRGLGLPRALVTCDEDNPGSVGTIEACGGVLEDRRPREDGPVTCRYWIELR